MSRIYGRKGSNCRSLGRKVQFTGFPTYCNYFLKKKKKRYRDIYCFPWAKVVAMEVWRGFHNDMLLIRVIQVQHDWELWLRLWPISFTIQYFQAKRLTTLKGIRNFLFYLHHMCYVPIRISLNYDNHINFFFFTASFILIKWDIYIYIYICRGPRS